MADADADAVMPSPPPSPPPAPHPLERFVLDPISALARAAARARPYLCSAIAWVLSAGLAAEVVARRVWGEGSDPIVFLDSLTGAAYKACFFFIFLFFVHMGLLVFLCGHDLLFLGEILLDLVLDFRKSDLGKIILESLQELNMSPRTVFLGGVAYVSCFLLMVTGCLVATMCPPVEEGSISQGEKIGSMIMDVGAFGIHAISCIIFIPAFAPTASDRRRSLLRKS